jgi:hypothetical protein
MHTVGFIDNPTIKKSDPVYECPKCGDNTAHVWHYTRIAPPRQQGAT